MSEWLGIPAAFVAWSFALYVFIVAPPTRGARFLVAMLVIDGLAVISSYGNSAVVDRLLGWDFLPWSDIHQASDWALVAVYLPFLGMTLQSSLVRPFKGRRNRLVILAAGLAIALSMFVLPESSQEVFRVPFYIIICVVLAWGFAAAMHSWYIAKRPAIRERARAFTIAFGARDVMWTTTFAFTTAYYYGLLGEFSSDETRFLPSFIAFVYAFAVIVYVPLVAYGVLRVQLFDIDLRIKRTLKRSTVAAAFVAAFFLVSELAGVVLSEQLGNVLGVVCTAALVFFLEPIQRAAQRFSDAAMPETQATPEYERYRKIQVYESAVHAALEEGGISDRQRRVLDSLVTSMGIDPTVASQLERDARESASA